MFERWKAARKEKQEREALKARKETVKKTIMELEFKIDYLDRYIVKRWGVPKQPTPEEIERRKETDKMIGEVLAKGGSVNRYIFPEKVEEIEHREQLKKMKERKAKLKEELKAIIEREEKENW